MDLPGLFNIMQIAICLPSVNLKSGDAMLISTIYDEDLAKVTFMLLPFLFRKRSMFMPSPSF